MKVIDIQGNEGTASQPLIGKNSPSGCWGFFGIIIPLVSAISGFAALVNGILSKTEFYNSNYEDNAKCAGIVWASSVIPGALLSLKARSFKPVILTLGGPVTGIIGACYIAWSHFAGSSNA